MEFVVKVLFDGDRVLTLGVGVIYLSVRSFVGHSNVSRD